LQHRAQELGDKWCAALKSGRADALSWIASKRIQGRLRDSLTCGGGMTTPDPMKRGETGPSPSEPPRDDLNTESTSSPIEAMPSLALLARLQQGETAARDELVRRYWPRLHQWARGRVPTGARTLYETDDLVQETMVAALDRLEAFEPEHDGALIAYFRTAIMNRVRVLARGVRRRRGDQVTLHEDLAHHGPSPLDNVIGSEALDRYEYALSRIRAEDREAIHLKVELDLPYDQITAALGKPTVTAARMAVSRALVRLAREMQRHA